MNEYLLKEIERIKNEDNGNKVHYIIVVFNGKSIDRMDRISSYTTASYEKALQEFDEWVESERKTLYLYTCDYVAVALEVWEVDDCNYLVDYLDTIRYEVLKDD